MIEKVFVLSAFGIWFSILHPLLRRRCTRETGKREKIKIVETAFLPVFGCVSVCVKKRKQTQKNPNEYVWKMHSVSA